MARTQSFWSNYRQRSTRSSRFGSVFDLTTVTSRPGFKQLRVTGAATADTFRNEAGGHRWQRLPPTDKRGRVHTSTITVAVLPERQTVDTPLLERDIEWQYFRGSGAGGQNRNKLETACRARHRPTGIVVRVETERKREQNKRRARDLLREKIRRMALGSQLSEEARLRGSQVGSGMRGDKIRTIRCQDDVVTCHVTGRKTTYKKYKRGDWSKLLEG